MSLIDNSEALVHHSPYALSAELGWLGEPSSLSHSTRFEFNKRLRIAIIGDVSCPLGDPMTSLLKLVSVRCWALCCRQLQGQLLVFIVEIQGRHKPCGAELNISQVLIGT